MNASAPHKPFGSAIAGGVLLLLAVGAAFYFVRTRPKPPQRPPQEIIYPVRVKRIVFETARLSIEAFGEIVPARQVELSAEVSGRIIRRHPQLEPGGRLATGEAIVELDSRDYEVAVAQAVSALEKARLDLALERSRARVAAEEWLRMGPPVETDPEQRALALRLPHVAAAEAAVSAAEAALTRARWNLERTVVRAPFDAVVLDRHAEVGEIAAPQTRLARLADARQFHARVALPTDDLRWISMPDATGAGGAPARIVHELREGRTIERTGRVVRLLSDLEPAGRMARLLIAIENPLDASELPLLLRAYVRAIIEGREVRNIVRLPIHALQEGNRVWLADTNDRLEIRPVQVLHQTGDEVWIADGLREGERVVLTRLAVPVEGLRLRIEPDQIPRRLSGTETGHE